MPKVFGLQGGSGKDFSKLYYHNHDAYGGLRSALRPSRAVSHIVAYMLHMLGQQCGGATNQDGIAAHTGPAPCAFTAVHVRIEPDWEAHCKNQAPMTGLRCLLREAVRGERWNTRIINYNGKC